MFYAHFVLSKKGPLARIWLAAHWDKKLTKAHVFETNIDSSVEAIIQPKVKLALRTSGHLLLGVVRIYSRKAKYLLADCNEAFVKIKMAFRPGVVDMPEENREAAVATITLPETFHDFETAMADLNDIDVQAQFSVNQSRPEEITMREDLGNITLVGDDGFGELGGFGTGDMLQDVQMDDTLYVRNPDSVLPAEASASAEKEQGDKPMDIDFGTAPDGLAEGLPDYAHNMLFGGGDFGETGGLFEEPPAVIDVAAPTQDQQEPGQPASQGSENKKDEGEDETILPETTTTSTIRDQTTLIPNEAEAFALEPIDVTSLGTERKAKRRRKLIIDEQKGIASETMKVQLSDTSDIVTTLDLAPPTKKLMHWKETGGVEKLFALSGRPLVSRKVNKLFNHNLVTRPITIADEEHDQLELEREEETIPEATVVQPPPPPPVTQIVEQPPVTQLVPQPSVTQLVEQPSIREREVARDEEESRTEDVGPPLLEPASILEDQSHIGEPARPSVSLVADTSSISRPHDETLQAPEEEPPAPMLSRRQSSEDEDVDDIFSNDLPDDLPAADGESVSSAADEEEQEERRWNKRTQQMSYVLNRSFTRGEQSVKFEELAMRNNRKQVASKFYTLLVLKKMQAVEVEQSHPYSDIFISQGAKFEVAV